MPRRARRSFWTEQAAYHVFSRGHNREVLFADESDLRAFLSLLVRYRDRFEAKIFHYCLMTNHFHLLVRLANPRDLSRMIAGFLRAYVHHYHRRHNFVGHLFQGRFKSPAIQRDGYWLSCGRYIERNPLEAGMVELPWEYPWSSAPFYALGDEDLLVTADPCYLDMAPEPGRRQALWRDFLLDEDPREEAIRKAEWAVGEDAFRQSLDRVHGRNVGHRRGRPRKGNISPQNLRSEGFA